MRACVRACVLRVAQILCRNQSKHLFEEDALAVKMLVDAHPEAAAATDSYGDQPLHWMVRNNAASVSESADSHRRCQSKRLIYIRLTCNYSSNISCTYARFEFH